MMPYFTSEMPLAIPALRRYLLKSSRIRLPFRIGAYGNVCIEFAQVP